MPASSRRTTSTGSRAAGSRRARGVRGGSRLTRCPFGVSPFPLPPYFPTSFLLPLPLPNSTPALYRVSGAHISAGYKFETLCTLPRPWGEVSRTEIEARPSERVSNKAQYCSIVSANIGPTKVCLAGEIDARRSFPSLSRPLPYRNPSSPPPGKRPQA